MNGYIGFFNRQRVEVYADTYFQAKDKVIAHFKVKPNRQHLVVVVLADKAGVPVEHTAA